MSSMASCRVCGKSYTPCNNTGYQTGVFRWREVSCSPECGAIYLQRIIESRNPSPKKDKKKTVKPVCVEVVVDDDTQVDAIDSNRD